MAFPTAACGCVREKRRPHATVEDAADFWFVVLTLDTYPLVDHERAVFLRSDCSSIAVGLQSFCSLFVVFTITAIVLSRIGFIGSCHLLLAALMLLVCNACPVSVSVRLACSAERDLRGTRDTTPALCSVCCCLPRLHPLLASMALPVGSRSVELSHHPRLGGARVARGIKRRSLRNGQRDEPHCAVVRM
jgi:hypothetical protein